MFGKSVLDEADCPPPVTALTIGTSWSVVGLALSAAATYAPKNIRVNCVAPGLTKV